MLRGWALNMTLFAKRENKSGFDYAAEEEARFRAIADGVPAAARVAWLCASVVLYFAFAMSFLVVLFTQFPDLPSLIGFCLAVVALLICLPAALTLAAGATGLLFRLPPLQEAAGDAALCRKIIGQFAFVAVVAIGSFVLITVVQAVWSG